jgi:hypothetical protein
MKKSLKTVLVPIFAVLVAGSAAALAGNDSFSAPEGGPVGAPPMSLYDKIHAHYAPLGRDVREEFRDGPCKVERHWERDGDFKEVIRCRGPRG